MVETIEHLKEMVKNLKFSGEIAIVLKYNYKLYKINMDLLIYNIAESHL